MTLKILRMGVPSLLRPSDAVVEFDSLEMHNLVHEMRKTMRATLGVGLAAPQVGQNQRLVVIEVPASKKSSGIPFTVLCNPVITPLSDEMEEDWEGCLSVPGFRGQVNRYKHIGYSGITARGLKIEREVKGLHARIVQHECDHLDGVLYPQKIQDMTKFGFADVLFPDLYAAPTPKITRPKMG